MTEAETMDVIDGLQGQIDFPHVAVTVDDTPTVNLTVVGQLVTANVLPAGVSHTDIGDIGTNSHDDIDDFIAAAPVILSGSAALTFGSILAGARATLTIAVTGAVTTDVVVVSPSANLTAGAVIAYAWVSAADTVSISVANITGSTIDVTVITFRVKVIR